MIHTIKNCCGRSQLVMPLALCNCAGAIPILENSAFHTQALCFSWRDIITRQYVGHVEQQKVKGSTNQKYTDLMSSIGQ